MTRLEPERLVVRNFVPDDWRDLQALSVQQEQSDLAAYDYEWPTSDEELQDCARSFSTGESLLAVCLRESGVFIGLISLVRSEQEHGTVFDLGYRFLAAYHGKGYATEACRAVLDHAFGRLGAHRVSAGTAAANAPSCRLLVRLGFARIAQSTVWFRRDLEGRPIEFLGHHFELNRDEWHARRRGRS